MNSQHYTLPYENTYGVHPADCPSPDVVIVGSGIGLAMAHHLISLRPELATRIVIVDGGPLDILTHISNTDVPRLPLLTEGKAHFGGKLSLWGVSTPRPPTSSMALFPWDLQETKERFFRFEKELGVLDPIPFAGGVLEHEVETRLMCQFRGHQVGNAPVAIDRFGRRWSSISYVPELVRKGVRILPRFRCVQLDRAGREVNALRGIWAVDDRVLPQPEMEGAFVR